MNFGRTAMGALLQFVSRPPGSYIAAAVLAALAIWGSGELGWRRGENYGQTACEAVHAAASVEEHIRQVRVAGAALRASETRTAQSAARDITNREIVAHVKLQVAALPPVPASCPMAVPAAVADGLRALR
jgi:hypothetical protein